MSVGHSPPTHRNVPALVSPAQIASPSNASLNDPSISTLLTEQSNSLSWSSQCKTPTLFFNTNTASITAYTTTCSTVSTHSSTTTTTSTVSSHTPIMTTCMANTQLPTKPAQPSSSSERKSLDDNIKNNTQSLQLPVLVAPKGAIPKKTSLNNGASKNILTPKQNAQKGVDRYFTLLKRKRSPRSSGIASSSKHIRDETSTPLTTNRYALLANEAEETTTQVKSFKPPPLYLREQNSNELIKHLIKLLGEKSFYVVPIKRGNIIETKIHVNTENDFRKLVSDFESSKKNFYTYQLKSSRGLHVVIKGIDHSVDTAEISKALELEGFKIKNVINIRNRERIPQPLFRVEFEHGDIKLKKGEVHPIYSLRYLLHRRVTVEEPHRRKGPTQCLNCQEYGHTRTYCHLNPVCVVCGELHHSNQCDKPREDPSVKKCSNCNKNHTANYRGCPVYAAVKQAIPSRGQALQTRILHTQNPIISQNLQRINNARSYSNVLKCDSNIQINPQNLQHNPNINGQPNPNTGVITEPHFGRLESTLDTLVLTINNFTNSINNMMQEMMRMQSMMLQAVLKKP